MLAFATFTMAVSAVAATVVRTPPKWEYSWDRFPAIWFGANLTGFENASQMALLGRFSMVIFGWQHMQLAANYSHLLAAQREQLRRVKARYPATPAFIYLPVAGAQPYYAAEAPLFAPGGDRPAPAHADTLFVDAAGAFFPNTSSYKCAGGTDLARVGTIPAVASHQKPIR